MIEIPQPLLAARAALEAAKARQTAIAGAASAIGAERAAAVARRAELARRRGAILKEKALLKAVIVGDVRMTARDIAAAERELAALTAEHDQLQHKAEEAEAGQLALAEEIAAAGAEVLDAARAFVQEHRRLDTELGAEFARDVGRLAMPDLFREWGAVGAHGIDRRLAGLTVAAFGGVAWDGCSDMGAPVLHLGVYRDPELGGADWKNSWRSDPALVARHGAFAELRTLLQRAEAMIAADKQQRAMAAERERLAEQKRRQAAYHPVPVNRIAYAPAMTRQEMEPRTPPPRVIGPVLGEAS
ncbi:MAG TPA: hypothetical protein VGM07_06150 [Stellaceae bacterium]|jgi:hypothetical protein